MDIQVVTLYPYPFPLKAVWTCRLYPFPPPVRTYLLQCQQYGQLDIQVATLYSFPPQAVWTCRVYPFPCMDVHEGCTHFTTSSVNLRVYPSPLLVARIYYSQSVRYWNEQKCWCQNHSGTGIRVFIPVPECSRIGTEIKDAGMLIIMLYIHVIILETHARCNSLWTGSYNFLKQSTMTSLTSPS